MAFNASPSPDVDASSSNSSENEGEDTNETRILTSNKHGGLQSDEDKFYCRESNISTNFRKKNRCLCEEDCLCELTNKDERGEEVVPQQLHGQRFTGRHFCAGS